MDSYKGAGAAAPCHHHDSVLAQLRTGRVAWHAIQQLTITFDVRHSDAERKLLPGCSVAARLRIDPPRAVPEPERRGGSAGLDRVPNGALLRVLCPRAPRPCPESGWYVRLAETRNVALRPSRVQSDQARLTAAPPPHHVSCSPGYLPTSVCWLGLGRSGGRRRSVSVPASAAQKSGFLVRAPPPAPALARVTIFSSRATRSEVPSPAGSHSVILSLRIRPRYRTLRRRLHTVVRSCLFPRLFKRPNWRGSWNTRVLCAVLVRLLARRTPLANGANRPRVPWTQEYLLKRLCRR